ncbi:MAG TPA: amidohydrolase family protein [Puia sp.]|uniref:amidohydrolase family protein n=1 Tax=Puia sp. TaxID=2045100 RepID=UPI002B9A84C6|nr:amidohydrolase family protein [Puia sp.]HVU95214.1 amidohydrolase family protein [Puia sp.]
MSHLTKTVVFFAFVATGYGGWAAPIDSTGKDTTKYTSFKDLPLKPQRTIAFTTTEGTWTSLDVSPDGKTIVFDMMGDLFTVPIAGGKATAVTQGIAFDSHPRWSPDGKKILFSSDRSGAENIWWIDLEKKDTFQVTKERDQNFPSAAWTPDGDYIVYSKGKMNVQLYLVHKDGGAGTQLISMPANLKTIDAAVSADGRYVYFSRRIGPWSYNADLPQYQVGVYDRENSKISTITSRYGSGFTPVLSKDGRWLVYGSRYEDKTGLVLRNLATGDEKWLAYPVQRDDQESIATMGVLPGMAFTPDSKAVVAAYGGKIHRIPLDGSAPAEIPFSVDLRLEVGPRLEFKYPVSDSAFGLATQIRDAVPSPDGKRLAFTVLDRLYVMDYPKGAAKRLTANNFTEAQPAWSRDGKTIVFVSWTPQGGQLYRVAAAGGPVQQLTKAPALYQSPAFDNSGDRIVFLRSQAQKYKDAVESGYDDGEEELCWMGANGGEITKIEMARGRANPHFVRGEDRIYLNDGNGDLLSIKWDGTDERTVAHITGITTYGISIYKHGLPVSGDNCMLSPEQAEAMEVQQASPAAVITMSPEGKRVIAQINNEIYTATIPMTGKTVTISVADASNAAFPARKLTKLGGEFPSWEADGKRVHWSLGNAHFVYDLEAAQSFDDSVKRAKKAEADSLAKVKPDTAKKSDSTKKSDSAKAKKKEPAYEAMETAVKVYYQRDIPQGVVLLKGARIITMEGDQVIENGDILVENNRIKGVGASGSLTVPAGAKVVDVAGKTIVPGFVDTHSHMWPQWGIHKSQVWKYAMNLAYGVTTTRDPQTATTDVLTYGDEVDAGMVEGPRIYSTGPGVGFWDYNVKDSAQAEDILRQYSKYYNTHYIKMYLTGNRQQREWIIMAARNQKLMPTTEGGLNTKLNITNLLDGYPGHEHAIPIYPLYTDLVKSIAVSQMCVTPTLIVAYGGPFAENYWWETENPYHDAKVQYFMPYQEMAAKTRRDKAGWFMPEEQVFPKHAKSMKAMVEAGALAGIGSHGEFNGIGYHWEMWAMGSGGMKPMDVLRAATILGATGLGLDQDLGSLKAGKLADLVILDKNPLENLRNTNTVKYVMKNGRLYDGNNGGEIYPVQRPLDRSDWLFAKPSNTTGVVE